MLFLNFSIGLRLTHSTTHLLQAGDFVFSKRLLILGGPELGPVLLAVLPPLPVVLSYRFAGRDLLLLDRTTGVILDFVDNALPPPRSSGQEG